MNARRYELTDFERSIIAPLLPNKPRGVARLDDRRVLNGIYWRLRTGGTPAEIAMLNVRRETSEDRGHVPGKGDEGDTAKAIVSLRQKASSRVRGCALRLGPKQRSGVIQVS